MKAHRPGDDEAREDVPDSVEGGGDDGGDVAVRRHGHGHHPIVGEVEEGEEHEEHVPQELGRRPVEPDHAVHQQPVHQGLSQDVRYLDYNLHRHQHIRRNYLPSKRDGQPTCA